MKTKSIITVLSIFFVLCILYITIQSTRLTKVIELDNYSDVIKLEISQLNIYSTQKFVLDDAKEIDEILAALNKAVLIPAIGNSRSYDYNPAESYEILIYLSNDFYYFIRIYANKYIGIDGQVYRMLLKSDLTKLQAITNHSKFR